MTRTTIIAISAFVAAISLTTLSAQAVTRDEVKAELAELRALGYRPEGEDPHYPQRIQEAMARLHQKRMAEQAGLPNATQHRTSALHTIESRFADQPEDSCSGPASFCNIYFGS